MLAPGTRLGSYEILSSLGAGGMGQVYRARDTKLGRDVALKVVLDQFTHDPERVARFHREAQLLAALNHPHIATIHGLEESAPSTHSAGSGQASSGQAAVHFLVMELVEGDTLADRIAGERGGPEGPPLRTDGRSTDGRRGGSLDPPIPLDEALAIARQIADALQAAHEKGIIHRDLKPANIALTADGQVKVLDFGLAKALEPEGAGSVLESPAMLTHSPTLAIGATQAGVILGTAAYMAPEQARGKVADRRSDIWAFGCIVYEMLTGKRPFDGEDMSDTLANILKVDPDWTALPADVPPAIRALLRRCLEKDRRKRVADIAAALFAIDEAVNLTAAEAPVHVGPHIVAQPPWRRALPIAAAVLVGSLITGLPVWTLMRASPPAPRLARFELPLLPPETFAISGDDPDLAISPDGSRVVFTTTTTGGQSLLAVRAIDDLAPRLLRVGSIARAPFISPDGAWIGFSDETEGTLKKVSILGGPAVRIALTGAGALGIAGASWGDDDTIVFGTAASKGLWRVAASGGTPTQVTTLKPGEVNHAWPEVLPSGRAVLFTILSGAVENAQIAVLNVATGQYRVLVPGGSFPRYSPSGHIVYAIGGTLRAVPFDLARLEVTGTPVPVLDGVVTKNGNVAYLRGAADFALARDGSLVYLSGSGNPSGLPQRTLVWVDRQGRETPITASPHAYAHPRLSPDGTFAALSADDLERDIWVADLGRTTLSRATFDPGQDLYPVWTPDGRGLIFSSSRAGYRNLFRQAADGTGAPERLTESTNMQNATAMSPDGRRLIFTENVPGTGEDIMQLELDAAHRATPLVQSRFLERNGIISPDGRWLAYEANDSGSFEIYVRPFPEVNRGRWQVSSGGGGKPLWTRNGQELAYVSPTGAVMGVGVERAPSWKATTAKVLVKEGYLTTIGAGQTGRPYDISPDGQKFLMIKNPPAQADAPRDRLNVVQHWAEELKRLVPTN